MGSVSWQKYLQVHLGMRKTALRNLRRDQVKLWKPLTSQPVWSLSMVAEHGRVIR